MKTRILKKINLRIKIRERDDLFLLEHRPTGAESWQVMGEFSTLKKAIHKKNVHIVMVVMRDLGYRNELVKRRTKRKKLK